MRPTSHRLFDIEWGYETGSLSDLGHIGLGPGLPVLEGKDDLVPVDEPYITLSVVYSPLPSLFENADSPDDMIDSHTIVIKTCRLYSGTRNRYRIRIQNSTDTTNISNTAAPTRSITIIDNVENGSMQNVRRSVAKTGLSLTLRPGEGGGSGLPKGYNGTLRLDLPPSVFQDAQCCSLYDTLGGLQVFVQDALWGNVTATYETPELSGIQLEMTGPLASQFMRSNQTAKLDANMDPFRYNIGWDDPTPLIFSTLGELMFRMAIDTAHSDLLQKVDWHYEDPEMEEDYYQEAPNRTTSTE